MNKTKKIQLMLSKEDLDNVKKVAKREGLNHSSFARRVVIVYCNKILKEETP